MKSLCYTQEKHSALVMTRCLAMFAYTFNVYIVHIVRAVFCLNIVDDYGLVTVTGRIRW